MKLKSLTFRESLLLQHRMISEGIVPFQSDHASPKAYLDSIPPEEARVIKRRFRKLFRKAIRDKRARFERRGLEHAKESWFSAQYGLGLTKKAMTYMVLHNRRSAVRTLLTLLLLREAEARRAC